MSDLPKRVSLHEEGPREGFQIEPGPIATTQKIALIDALSETGLKQIQIASFVNPKRVPGWADADAVIDGIRPNPGIRYTALWLNQQGIERALAHRDRLSLRGIITLCPSEPFLQRNQNRDIAENLEVQRSQAKLLQDNDIASDAMLVMAAFGCNFAGDIPVSAVVESILLGQAIAAERGFALKSCTLADTMAWATPQSIRRVVGELRQRWPELRLALHLHDTRGLGIANAYAGLEMGVDSFDASIGGLGGCPFAGHQGAAGNVCTEDLAFMCAEMGIETGLDLDRLIEAAQLAESIVGHPLPGAVKRGGTLARYRAAQAG